jgi:hypothetical protein
MIEAGAYPSPLNYYNFPKSVCTSINEVRMGRAHGPRAWAVSRMAACSRVFAACERTAPGLLGALLFGPPRAQAAAPHPDCRRARSRRNAR